MNSTRPPKNRTPWNERPMTVPQEILDLADEADVEALALLLPMPRGAKPRDLLASVRILVETQHIGAEGPPDLSESEKVNLRRVASLVLHALRVSKK